MSKVIVENSQVRVVRNKNGTTRSTSKLSGAKGRSTSNNRKKR